MTSEEVEIIRSAIREKIALMDTMSTQMEPYRQAQILSGDSLKKFQMAKDTFAAAWLKLESNDLEKAVYFMLRGSWNLGEFLALSRADKAAHPEFAVPTVNAAPEEP